MKKQNGNCRKYQYWLASLLFLTGQKKICLENLLGGAEQVYRADAASLRHIRILTERERENMQKAQQKTVQELELEMEKCIKSGIRLAVWKHPDYPDKLKTIDNPPYGLFYQGKLPRQEKKAVGVVGARNCTSYGKAAAAQIGQGLAEAGVSVYSGMALGIDGAAQIGALKGGGYTCGVLGSGVDVCYPSENRELYRGLIENGGVLSEYPPHTPPAAWNFPQRNRIISGLSDCVLVVEAREKSGSLITADFALEQGKDIYAVPGRISDISSQGTNRLIQQGAGIFLNMEDFLKEMHIFSKTEENSFEKKKLSLENLERLVYSCLDFTPRDLEGLLAETGLSLGVLTEKLETLQEKGCVSQVYKNYYIRSDSFV